MNVQKRIKNFTYICSVIRVSHKQQRVPTYTFTYQSPPLLNLEFLQLKLNLYVTFTFMYPNRNLSLEFSDQIGKTLAENCEFTVEPQSPFNAVHIKPRLFICRTTWITHRTHQKKKKTWCEWNWCKISQFRCLLRLHVFHVSCALAINKKWFFFYPAHVNLHPSIAKFETLHDA